MTSGKIKIAAVSDSAADESEFDSYPIPEDQFFDSPLQRAVRKDMELDIKDKLIYNRKKAERRSRNDETLDAGDEKDPESSREEKQTAAGDESSMGSSSTLTRPSAIDSKRSHEALVRPPQNQQFQSHETSFWSSFIGQAICGKSLLPSVNSISNIDISGEEKIDTPKEKAVKEVDMAALEGSSKLDIETDIDIKIPLLDLLQVVLLLLPSPATKKDHDSTKSNSSSRLIVKPKDHDAKIQLSSAMKTNPTVNDIPAQSLHNTVLKMALRMMQVVKNMTVMMQNTPNWITLQVSMVGLSDETANPFGLKHYPSRLSNDEQDPPAASSQSHLHPPQTQTQIQTPPHNRGESRRPTAVEDEDEEADEDSDSSELLITTNDNRVRLCSTEDYSMICKYKGGKNKIMQIKKANRATVGSGFLSFGKRKDRDANYYSFLPSDGDMRKQSDPQSHQSAAITAALFAPTGTVHNILKRFSVQKDVIDFLSSSE
eukprot:gene19175-19548_t